MFNKVYYAGFDTETTGLNPFHGDLPFMACITFSEPIPNEQGSLIPLSSNGKNQITWEWPVDPLTRIPQYDYHDLLEIVLWLQRTDIIWLLHNAKFDVRMIEFAIKFCLGQSHPSGLSLVDSGEPAAEVIEEFDPLEFLDRCQETAMMSHAIDNRGSHGLKDLGIRYLNIGEDDKEELKKQVESCYPLAYSLGWKVANKENCPQVVAKPDDGWWVMDMWIPSAVQKYLHEHPQHIELVNSIPISIGLDPIELNRNTCNTYCLRDTQRTLLLGLFLTDLLKQQDLLPAYQLNKVQLPVLYSMEDHGLPILMDTLDSEQSRLLQLARNFETNAKRIIQDPYINLNSPQQVASALLRVFNVKLERKTADGKPTVDKTDVEKLYIQTENELLLISHDPSSCPNASLAMNLRNFLFCYMAYRKCNKSADQDLVRYRRQAINGVVHFSFNGIGTDTTRLSSDGGQNISKGKAAFNEAMSSLNLSLRKVFGPSPGRKWYSIDYVQLQLVIFAFVSKEPNMMHQILQGNDLHDYTHRKLAELLSWSYNPEDKGQHEAQRTIAKNCNFGFIFGAGPAKIEQTARISGLYEVVQSLFPTAHAFVKRNIRLVKDQGYVMAGPYRLFVPPDAPYAATNYIVQGYEGIIVKRAMRTIWNGFKDTDCRLILSVHDELIIDTPANYKSDHGLSISENALQWTTTVMEEAGRHYGIPCKAEAKEITTNWSEGKKVQNVNA